MISNRPALGITVLTRSTYGRASNVLGGKFGGRIREPDPAADLISLTTNRKHGDPMATFTLHLRPDPRWLDRIKPMDFVRIELWRPGNDVEGDHILFGYVDRVGMGLKTDGPKPMTTMQIQGYSSAALLNRFQVYFFTWVSQELKTITELSYAEAQALIGSVVDRDVLNQATTPPQIIAAILGEWTKGIEIELPPGLYLAANGPRQGVIHWNPEGTERYPAWAMFDPGAKTPAEPLYDVEGPVWTVLKTYADDVFHELFVDVNPNGKWEEVVFRPRPFAKTYSRTGSLFDPGAALTTVEITDSDVLGQDVSQGVTDAYSGFWVLPRQVQVDENTLRTHCPPVIVTDPASPSYYRRIGLRMMEVGTRYIDVDSEDKDSPLALITEKTKAWANVLRAWYEHNPDLWSGELTVLGRAAFRPGRRLLYHMEHRGIDREFYIEGASNNYDAQSGRFTTTMSVTRGRDLAAR